MKKLYAQKGHATTTDEHAIRDWKWLQESTRSAKEVGSDLGTHCARVMLKIFSDKVRNEIDTPYILGFVLADAEEEKNEPERLVIVAFNALSTSTNYYPVKYDEGDDSPYIEVTDEEYDAAMALGEDGGHQWAKKAESVNETEGAL